MLNPKQKQQDNKVSPRFLEELLRGIRHDIGAPVRHIVHFSQMLNEQVMNASMETKHERWLSMIHDSGQQLQNMLESLTEFSHLSTQRCSREQLDLRSIFNQELAFHQKNSVADNTQIAVTLSEEWPTVIGYREHWTTLFFCLLENACKFQPMDAKHIIHIAAHCEYHESSLTFIIEDNGIGVKATQWQEISRPFKRLHSVADYAGIGMGLAYCDFIAELNGANLSFEQSELGGLRIRYCQADIQRVTPTISCTKHQR